jgi:hypothetical protein
MIYKVDASKPKTPPSNQSQAKEKPLPEVAKCKFQIGDFVKELEGSCSGEVVFIFEEKTAPKFGKPAETKGFWIAFRGLDTVSKGVPKGTICQCVFVSHG